MSRVIISKLMLLLIIVVTMMGGAIEALGQAVALPGQEDKQSPAPLGLLPDFFAPIEPVVTTNKPALTVQLKWRYAKAHAGDKRVLAVVLKLEKGWHINSDQAAFPKDHLFVPTELIPVKIADDLLLESARFPEAHWVPFSDPDLIPVFEDGDVLYIPMKVADDAKPGKLKIELDLVFGACNDRLCLLKDNLTLEAELEIVAAGQDVGQAQNEGYFKGFATAGKLIHFDFFGYFPFDIDTSNWLGLVLLLIVAMIGGALLNFTPCVLPVIPIKIMGLSQSAGSRKRMIMLGMVMSLGVVGFWVLLGGMIASITGFTATNQLFQYPPFTIGIGVIIGIMAVGMCGLFAVQLPQWVYRVNPKHDSYIGSFGFGVMTAVLSTPCTAPFMGAAAAWSATQLWTTTLVTFGAIGVGMATPYLLLSMFPGLVAKVPRTGPSSVLLKQVMGLFMLAVAAWFIGIGISVLAVKWPDPPSLLYWWVVAALVAGTGLWLAYRGVKIAPSAFRRVLVIGLGAVFVVVGIYGGVRFTDRGPVDWVYYTPERYEQAKKQGRVIVLDFTASWCANCIALEHSVLFSDKVAPLLNSEDVVPMKVDLSGNHPLAKKKLKESGRLMIPLLVIYSPEGQEIFKSDFYTPNQVIQAIALARGETADSTAAISEP